MQWLSPRFCGWCNTTDRNDLTPPYSNNPQQQNNQSYDQNYDQNYDPNYDQRNYDQNYQLGYDQSSEHSYGQTYYDNSYSQTYADTYSNSQSSMQQATRSSPLTLQIQPPLLATPHHPLFPPPTALLTTPPTSPFSPQNSNFVGIACAVSANSTPPQSRRRGSLLGNQVGHDDVVEEYSGSSVQGQTSDVMSGTLAVSGTPLQDGTGVAFVFRSLNIRQVGEWRVKIVVMQMSSEGGEARCCGEVLSTVVRVGEENGGGESERLGNLCECSYSI